MRLTAASAAALLLLASPALARVWQVDHSQSRLGFVAQQGTNAIEGTFQEWTADIQFDPAALDKAQVTAEIQLASVSTGAADRDGMLASPAFFDTSAGPTARFQAIRFTSTGADAYSAEGSLTLKGITVPVTLPFTLTITGDKAVMRGETGVDRLALTVGSGQWADPATIAVQVKVVVEITATGG